MDKSKFMLLIVLIVGACAISILRGPFYEAVVDISVNPPKEVRKTDFSWITVNEWFNGQVFIITSHVALKDASFYLGIDEEKIKGMVEAKRLGAADIIRISARANERPEILAKLVDCVTISYLETLLDKPEEEIAGLVKSKVLLESAKKQEIPAKTAEVLYSDALGIKKEIISLEERLGNLKNELKEINKDIIKSTELNSRLAQIENEIRPLHERAKQLKTIYTDNWPELSVLNQKIKALEETRASLSTQLPKFKNNEEHKNIILFNIEKDTKTLESLRKNMELVNNQLAELIRVPLVVNEGDEENILSESTQISPKLKSNGAIINPTAINFLPDLWIQLVYGAFAGTGIWLLLLLVFKKNKFSIKR